MNMLISNKFTSKRISMKPCLNTRDAENLIEVVKKKYSRKLTEYLRSIRLEYTHHADKLEEIVQIQGE
jgi:hypothetical protein